MDQDLIKIKKVAIFSLISLLVIGVACFFIFEFEAFLNIVIGQAIALVIFIGTLFSYYIINRRKLSSSLKFVLGSFLVKLIFSGMVFYLLSRLNFINLLILLLSFLIFYTIFLSLEVFLIYRKLLFR